jgi:beta-lactamase regulating signal transducer with metallopeptidase domain
MSTFLFDLAGAQASMPIAVAIKASVLLGLTALASLVLRRRASAATRHWVCTLAVAGLLVLPVLSLALPSWNVSVPVTVAPNPVVAAGLPPPRNASADRRSLGEGGQPSDELGPAVPQPGSEASSPAPSNAVTLEAETTPAPTVSTVGITWTSALLGLYAAGALLLIVRLIVQHIAARRLVRSATEVVDANWLRLLDECARRLDVTVPVRLLRSREKAMPMAVGASRHAILIPSVADTWTVDRRRAVILHELAHIARRDCLTQMLAAVVCALYWVHPGAWWVARRLRVERELACDDRVLRAGEQAREYAGHLLDLAYSLGAYRAPTLVVSMARPGQLEGRMLAVLDAARNRAMPGLGSHVAGIALAVAVLLPLARVEATVVPMSLNVDVPAGTAAPTVKAETAALPSHTSHDVAHEAPAAQAQPRMAGTWQIRPAKTAGMVYLEMREENNSSGTTVPTSQLQGLTAAQMAGGSSPVKFTFGRDAGTFTFEGMFRDGLGGGTYSFAANTAFPAELEKRGIARPSATEQYELAKHDVGLALVDELNRQGYPKPSVADLVRAGHHGVRLDYVKELDQLGYRVGSMDALVKLRDHGVTPSYIREMSAIGLPKLSADELVRVRDHGVTPEFARELKDAGYGSLTIDQLVKTRDHGVTPEYIRELKALGYGSLDLEQLIKTRDHGVTPEFVKSLSAFGYTKLSLDQVVNARDHGVTPEYISELGALGHAQLPLDRVVNARDHGVTPGYIRELKALGYDNLPLDEVVRLRDHGVTADKIKRANEKAGTKLPLDMVRSMVDGGGLR